ncbi:anti-repressor SinI family protein [Alicyclobacillus dauci]|uniref:Anti-repressor SinI family protein n=1 Tax=Alicyclobacillus dauci TaxID=1475485 RepID=A0ABY6Z1L0_9BACL|nr:anti-repressor SinI family protein [Alicyclobacillus dauci]WAH36769.1 anti-repressor SinI family protein [Alicyclobacillus dauci]
MPQKSEEYIHLDKEWVHLMSLAKQMGLTVAEVRRYLQESLHNSVSTTSNTNLLQA